MDTCHANVIRLFEKKKKDSYFLTDPIAFCTLVYIFPSLSPAKSSQKKKTLVIIHSSHHTQPSNSIPDPIPRLRRLLRGVDHAYHEPPRLAAMHNVSSRGSSRITGEESHRHVDSPMSGSCRAKSSSSHRHRARARTATGKARGKQTRRKRSDDGRETEIPWRTRLLVLLGAEVAAFAPSFSDHLLRGEGERRFLCATLGRH